MITSLQDAYVVKIKSVRIDKKISSEYLKAFETNPEKQELFKILSRDVAFIHQESLNGQLTKIHQNKICKTVQECITEYKSTTATGRSNSNNNIHNDRLDILDKTSIAENLHTKVSSKEWWQSLAAEGLECRNKLEASVEQKINRIYGYMKDDIRCFTLPGKNFKFEAFKDHLKTLRPEAIEQRIEQEAAKVFKYYTLNKLEALMTKKLNTTSVNETFEVLKEERDFCKSIWQNHPRKSLGLNDEMNGRFLVARIGMLHEDKPGYLNELKHNSVNVIKLAGWKKEWVEADLKSNESPEQISERMFDACKDKARKIIKDDLELLRENSQILLDGLKFTKEGNYLAYRMIDPVLSQYYKPAVEVTDLSIMTEPETKVHQIFTEKQDSGSRTRTKDQTQAQTQTDIEALIKAEMSKLAVAGAGIVSRAVGHFAEYNAYQGSDKKTGDHIELSVKRAIIEEENQKKWRHYVETVTKHLAPDSYKDSPASIMSIEIDTDRLVKMHSNLAINIVDNEDYIAAHNEIMKTVRNYYVKESASIKENIYNTHEQVIELAKTDDFAARHLACSIADFNTAYKASMLTQERIEMMTKVARMQTEAEREMNSGFEKGYADPELASQVKNLKLETLAADKTKAVEFTTYKLGHDLSHSLLMKSFVQNSSSSHKHEIHTIHQNGNDTDHLHHSTYDNTPRSASDNIHHIYLNDYHKEHIHNVVNFTQSMQADHGIKLEQHQEQQHEHRISYSVSIGL